MCHKGEKKTMRMCAIKEKFKKQHTHVRMKRKKYCHNMQRKEAIYIYIYNAHVYYKRKKKLINHHNHACVPPSEITKRIN